MITNNPERCYRCGKNHKAQHHDAIEILKKIEDYHNDI